MKKKMFTVFFLVRDKKPYRTTTMEVRHVMAHDATEAHQVASNRRPMTEDILLFSYAEQGRLAPMLVFKESWEDNDARLAQVEDK